MNRLKIMCFLLAMAMLLLSACGKEQRTVICDGCGAQIQVDADSNITDEWILFCDTCEKDLFGEDGIVPKA